MCPQAKDLTSFTCFQEVLDAYLTQLRFYVGLAPVFDAATMKAYAERTPSPFASSLMDSAIKLKKDIMEGEGPVCYNTLNIVGMGVINATNSLAALKRIVFEDKLVSLLELKEVLKENFKGETGEAAPVTELQNTN